MIHQKSCHINKFPPKTRQPSTLSWWLPVAFCMLLLENETFLLRNEAQIVIIQNMIYIFVQNFCFTKHCVFQILNQYLLEARQFKKASLGVQICRSIRSLATPKKASGLLHQKSLCDRDTEAVSFFFCFVCYFPACIMIKELPKLFQHTNQHSEIIHYKRERKKIQVTPQCNPVQQMSNQSKTNKIL